MMITAVNMLNTNAAQVLFGVGGTYDITNINFAAGASQFIFGHDNTDGNDFIQAVTPCFLAGTRTSTEHGEVVVEELSEGDRCMTGTCRGVRARPGAPIPRSPSVA